MTARRMMTRTPEELGLLTLFRRQREVGQRFILQQARLVDELGNIGKNIPKDFPPPDPVVTAYASLTSRDRRLVARLVAKLGQTLQASKGQNARKGAK